MTFYSGYPIESSAGYFIAPRSSSFTGKHPLNQGAVTVRATIPGATIAADKKNLLQGNSGSFNGYIVPSFLSYFYNRIAVIPAVQALGSISNEQHLTVQIWNAYLTEQTLVSITMTGDNGITITGPDIPLTFNRLAIYKWNVYVAMDGPDEINLIITWQFNGLAPVIFRLTGRRSVPWMLMPDWSDGITESLEFKTDVLRSITGAEQRISRRLTPRRIFEFPVIVGKNNRQRLENAIYHFAARRWSLPIYTDITYTNTNINAGDDVIYVDTRFRDFSAGGLAVICSDASLTATSEIIEIRDLDTERLLLSRPIVNTWSVNSMIIPVRAAMLTDTPKLTRLSDTVSHAQIRFQIVEHCEHDDNVNLPVYRNHYVIEPGSNWADDLTAEYTRLISTLDNQTGIPYTIDTAGIAFTVQSHHFTEKRKALQSVLKSLIYYLRGRQRVAWVYSQSSDIYPIANISGSLIDIEYIGISETRPVVGRRDIRIETDKGIYYRRIINAVPLTDNTERIALDDDGLDILLNTIRKISFMSLMRLNSDSVQWHHLTDDLADIAINFVSVNDELE